jgi:hypothetical protein
MNKNCPWCRKLINRTDDRTFALEKKWHTACYKLFEAAGFPAFDVNDFVPRPIVKKTEMGEITVDYAKSSIPIETLSDTLHKLRTGKH